MVVFLLQFQATLENVAEIFFHTDMLEWCMDIAETGGSGRRSRVRVSPHECCELTNSRGTAHFAVKWEGQTRQASLNILFPTTPLKPPKGVKPSYTRTDAEKKVAIAAFECRGLEPTACYCPNFGISVVTTSGKRFDDVDFSEGEWCDYDDKANQSVGVYSMQWSFATGK